MDPAPITTTSSGVAGTVTVVLPKGRGPTERAPASAQTGTERASHPARSSVGLGDRAVRCIGGVATACGALDGLCGVDRGPDRYCADDRGRAALADGPGVRVDGVVLPGLAVAKHRAGG